MASTKISALTALAGGSVADNDPLVIVDTTAAATRKLDASALRDGYLKTGLWKIDATVAPGVSNDDTEGYQVGSHWVDVTADKAYVCLDASTGAAVWMETTQTSGSTSPLTTKGDIWVYGSADTRLPIGTDGFVLKADSGDAEGMVWADAAATASPLTTKGDIWVYGTADTRIPIGTNGQILKADSTDAEGMVWAGESVVLAYALSDETTALTTGTAKVTARAPFAFTLTDVRASVTTAPTGSVLTVDINESGTTVLSTKLTIDATEKTSETAATAAVISDTAIADDAELTFDIDTIGSTVAGAGLKVQLIGTKP